MLSHRPSSPALKPRRTPLAARGRSKMLGVYLDDVEQLLQRGKSEQALQLAILLPHLVAALEDPRLHGDCAAADAWAQRWLELPGGDAEFAAQQAKWHRDCVPGAGLSPTTEAGLRQLRLRRHVRESITSPYVPLLSDAPPPAGSHERLAFELAEAVREWYAERGLDDPRVQENHARLMLRR